jgi:hypothetical protein
MKKVLLFALFAVFSLVVNAQNYKNDGKPYAFYCQLVGFKNLAAQLRLKVLWNNMKDENNLRDENGKKIEFNTMVDAMNYMSKRGWDYVECVTYKEGTNNVVHYIFRKYVTNDEEAKEGLYFESDFKKK